MAWLGVIAAALVIAIVLIDTFEAMLLPRRVKHAYRLARLYYRGSWAIWRRLAGRITLGRVRLAFLSVFGPLSLFGLIFVWVFFLITGFALLHWSLGTRLTFLSGEETSFTGYLYFSGTTFFTLGYGDVVPTGPFGRALSVAEAGLGFGFLAAVIGYLPAIYQAFSRREIVISLLDARAGSPPSAGELLRRLASARRMAGTPQLLAEWERWAAELLESHLSFPVLSFYRSQHDNQSWIATLTLILDTSALLIAGVECPEKQQARLTFAMARHAAVDLGLTFLAPPRSPREDRLPASQFAKMRETLQASGLVLTDGPAVAKALIELRGLYEPFLVALSDHLQLPLPEFFTERPQVDNWQTSPWMPRAPGIGGLPGAVPDEEHL
jgi:hypothetical protein